MPPCQGASRLSTASKLWACPSWEVWGRKLGELPGHPGPDGRRNTPGALEGGGELTGVPTNGTSRLDDCGCEHRRGGGGGQIQKGSFETYLCRIEHLLYCNYSHDIGMALCQKV